MKNQNNRWTEEEFKLINNRLGRQLEWCGVQPSRDKVPAEQVRRDFIHLFKWRTTEPKPRTGGIYLIQCEGTNLYKIGIAINPLERLTVLQTGCPHHLRLVHTLETRDASREENGLHDILHSFHTRGEWFELSAEYVRLITASNTAQDAVNALSLAQYGHDMPLYEDNNQ